MKKESSQKDSWSLYQRLFSYVGSKQKGLWVAVFAMLCFAAVDTAFVYTVKPLIDDGITGKNPDLLRLMPIVVMVIIILRGSFSFIASYCMSWVGNHVVMGLQKQVFSRLARLPVAFFDTQPTGVVVSKMTYDATQVAQAASSALIAVFREGATVIGLLGLMFYHSWQLSTIFLIVGPLVGFCIALISGRYRQVSHQLQDAMGVITTATEQSIKGHREVLMFGAADVEEQRFARIANHVRQQRMKIAGADAISNPAIQIVASSALAALLYIASFESVRSQLTPGTFTVVITAMMMLLKPLKSLTQINAELQKGLAACMSLFTFIDSPVEQDMGVQQLKNIKGKVTFDTVSFMYPSQLTPALKNVSFTVEPGKMVALVGRSGSGKSTIASLLTRFYSNYSGRILVDDVDIQEVQLSSLRSQLGFVSQHVHLFNDTVAGNIAYASHYQREQIIVAAKMADAHAFIEQLPNSYETLLGENGAILSGGQRQRIAIARALLLQAPILLLDEATSALDNDAEGKIQQAVDLLGRHTTIIVIAHRLSTVEKADEILVIDDGVIVERGSHEQLLLQQGHYTQLHARELKQAS